MFQSRFCYPVLQPREKAAILVNRPNVFRAEFAWKRFSSLIPSGLDFSIFFKKFWSTNMAALTSGANGGISENTMNRRQRQGYLCNLYKTP